MPLATGSKAPDFTLKTKTADGLQDVTLSANFGKKSTVILFFPLAYTGVCTQEMCHQTAGLGDYEKLGASVLAISVDSPFALEAWAQKELLCPEAASARSARGSVIAAPAASAAMR